MSTNITTEQLESARDIERERLSNRLSHVINRAYVRRWALDYARTNRSHPFTRVSEDFLNHIEAQTKCAIRHRIDSAPSTGATLK
jgi:hypothetical protein